MYDYAKELESKIEFYSRPKLVEDPYHPAGFRGTWNFSEHSKIPDVLHGFLQRYFGHMRLSRIPIDQINKVMNEVWEGPGSLTKVFQLEEKMRAEGKTVYMSPADYVKAKKYDDDEAEDEGELVLELPENLFEEDEE